MCQISIYEALYMRVKKNSFLSTDNVCDVLLQYVNLFFHSYQFTKYSAQNELKTNKSNQTIKTFEQNALGNRTTKIMSFEKYLILSICGLWLILSQINRNSLKCNQFYLLVELIELIDCNYVWMNFIVYVKQRKMRAKKKMQSKWK